LESVIEGCALNWSVTFKVDSIVFCLQVTNASSDEKHSGLETVWIVETLHLLLLILFLHDLVRLNLN
jgi:hypothetical protein